MKTSLFLCLFAFQATLPAENILSTLRPASNKNPQTGLFIKAQYLYQDAEYQLRSLQLSPANPAAIPLDVLTLLGTLGPNVVTGIDDSFQSASVFLEWKPVEWLGLNARLGTLEGEAKISLVAPFNSTTLDYSGYSYGFGPTIYLLTEKCSYKGFQPFALFSAEWVKVEFDDDAGSSQTYAIRSKVGYKSDSFAFWVGATWQDNTQRRKGNLNLPPLGESGFRSVSEDVVHWNYVVGMGYQFNDSIKLGVEYGFGEREHLGVLLNYRF